MERRDVPLVRAPGRATSRLVVVVVVCAVAVASLTAAAGAPAINPACYEKPTKARAKRIEGKPRPPLVIGDSIMKYSVPLLGKDGFDADARACRSFVDAKRMIRKRKRDRTLPNVVVIALGGNGPFTVRDIAGVVRTMGRHRRLALLTARFSGDRPGYGADAIHAAHRRYPYRVRVLDWVKLSTGKPSWFAPDGVHLGSKAGIRAYTKLIESGYRRGDDKLGER